MKVAAPTIGICYLTFIWIPGSPIVTAYVVLGVIGGASFTLLPVTLEWLAKETEPAPPEVSSILCWMIGQLLGIVFTISMQNLKTYGDPAVPNGDMKRYFSYTFLVRRLVVLTYDRLTEDLFSRVLLP